MSNILNDRIIDDQGNARTVANGQDARLAYIDVFGNRKKYLLEGELEIGDVKVPTKTSDLQNDSGFITADDIPAANSNIIRDLTFEDEKTAVDNVFTVDFDGSAIQRFSTAYTSSDGIINFNINYSAYQANTCPTIQVMVPYTATLTTFYFPTEVQQINIPQQIEFNSEYTYNYAVFVFRRIGNQFYINYSYSYGSN